MRKLILGLILTVGVCISAHANIGQTTGIEEVKKPLSCTSTTTTTTNTNPKTGQSTSTSVTTVTCDTPAELAAYQVAIKKLKLRD